MIQTTPGASITKSSFGKQEETDVVAGGGRRKQGSAPYPWWKPQ